MPWKNEPELTRSPSTEEVETPELSNDLTEEKASESSATRDKLSLSSGTIEASLKELIVELKRKRRWGFALKLIGWLIIAGLIGVIFTGQHKQIAGEHTALVRLEGIIADGYDASAENVLAGLTSAFKSDNAKGVILAVNSPGGSPVQADMLYQEIQRLKVEHDKPIVAVISDVGASGGYYAAVAADKIYANPSSIVGSIGVLMNGFGFVDLMHKAGIERRLLTAGKYKGSLDPFSPIKEEELEHAKTVIEGVHKQFIDVVRKSRGSRLKETEDIFSGLFYNGDQAYEMGLTDGFKTHWAVARDDIGEEEIVDYTLKPDMFERFTRSLGVAIAERLKLTLSDSIPNLQ